MPRNAKGKICGTGGHRRKYCFTVVDYSLLFGKSVQTILRWQSKRKIDLADLNSVVSCYLSREKEKRNGQKNQDPI